MITVLDLLCSNHPVGGSRGQRDVAVLLPSIHNTIRVYEGVVSLCTRCFQPRSPALPLFAEKYCWMVCVSYAHGHIGLLGQEVGACVHHCVAKNAVDASGSTTPQQAARSRYASQPANAKEGLSAALGSISRGVRHAANTIVAIPMREYQRSGPQVLQGSELHSQCDDSCTQRALRTFPRARARTMRAQYPNAVAHIVFVWVTLVHVQC